MATYGEMSTFRQGATQNVSYSTSGGTSALSSAFGTQTRVIRLSVPGAISATSGVRYVIGDGSPTATSTGTLLPLNWVEYVLVTPGEKVAVLSNDTVAGTMSVVELV